MADRLGIARERIAAFKRLALRAVVEVAQGADGYGVLLDGEHGREALFDATEHNLWIGRPVERPGSRPLAFITPDLGSHLAEWPLAHTVKCLCHYHPEDPAELKERQEAALLTAYEACRATGRELIIDIIAGGHGELGETTIAEILGRLYALGIRPDWWKLESQASDTAWRAVEMAVRTGYPYCRGVILLGLDASEDKLVTDFALAARYPIMKGFAIGRTIWSQAAERWLAGEISDQEAIADMGARFQQLSHAWDRAVQAREAA
jgi:5-dehydro-2-deoxygluconokinase